MKSLAAKVRKIANECAVLRIRQASRLLTRTYDDALRTLGIQESQLALLIAVASCGDAGAPMTRVAEVLVMDRTTVSRNVVPLEKAGLLRVARSATDARARVILLTRAGGRMIEAAYPRWKEAQDRVRAALGGKRFDALRAELSAVVRLAT